MIDLVVMEQLLNMLPGPMSTWVCRHQSATVEETVRLTEAHQDAAVDEVRDV